MHEREVDHILLEKRAREIISRLKKTAEKQDWRRRTYSPNIQAVLVFSGPGTYFEPLKPDQAEYFRWRDRDRIRAGVGIVAQVTARTMRKEIRKNIKGHKITKEDIANFGPMFVYNGTPVENEVFKRALDSPNCRLPKEKVVVIEEVVVIDEVTGQLTTRAISHTGDQVKSFFDELENQNSPLNGLTNIGLVSNVSGVLRVPFYTKKHNDIRKAKELPELKFWIYAIKDRQQAETPIIESELKSLVTYAMQGDLAIRPSAFTV